MYNLHLSSVIELLGLKKTIIHYVKIDAQGSDLDVFKSLGKYARNVLFVQVESVVSRNQNIRLYERQSLFEEERPVFERAGFQLFHVQEYSRDASPEADVVYVNQRLFRDLLGEISRSCARTQSLRPRNLRFANSCDYQ
ncbi:MAG TPA: FkbM family methyltransferase [Candidatus Bathyarchaeia archaeon]|nr:FkbM family methyltransferase [Candidatus Bathyarchaeia archaeon]